ncbi:hypothetical protein AAFC00_000684 [Neodothiora populina]|uniref:Metallo-beta-lactamase domain-containing protein n=1 Tax=Neodothiora populina TaxID=2781224 RepID=A0ABR3PDQ8_9PEZI
MSTFSGIVKEFPRIQIDNFRLYEDHQPPLACFLSHIHSDHLTSLDTNKSSFVYCTAPTRELVLKLERYPHRVNFAKGILETRKQTYRKIKRLLKPIPLETPTVIELTRGYSIQVTLFDANHCTGSCMFLIEGDGKAVLYTGDVRSESWWVDSLVRNPILIPYTKGLKQLDNVYLDTTFSDGAHLKMDFPTKADGLAELLEKVSKYPPDQLFYLDAWTFGYEEVWVALCKALNTRVHLCNYRYRVYSSMMSSPECFGPHTAALLGFQFGNRYHEGCLTNDPVGSRLHSCERGTGCSIFSNKNAVRITPIVTRHHGVNIAELGAGGGYGDLDQQHELELNDIMAVAQLINMCRERLQSQPVLLAEITDWFSVNLKPGPNVTKLDFAGFWNEVKGDDDEFEIFDDMPLDRLIGAIAKLFSRKVDDNEESSRPEDSRRIRFPFSRHSSYNELRYLVKAFMPRDLYPCTVTPSSWTVAISMKTLFGDICSADIFAHDQRMFALKGIEANEVNGALSQAQSDAVTEDVQTTTQKRKLSPSHAGSSGTEASPSSPIVLKRLKTKKAPLPTVQVAEESETTSLPRSRDRSTSLGPGPRAVTTEEEEETAITTPKALTSTSMAMSSASRPDKSDSRERLARRAEIAREVRRGGEWQGLRSVSGYHNQGLEEEL